MQQLPAFDLRMPEAHLQMGSGRARPAQIKQSKVHGQTDARAAQVPLPSRRPAQAQAAHLAGLDLQQIPTLGATLELQKQQVQVRLLGRPQAQRLCAARQAEHVERQLHQRGTGGSLAGHEA